MLTPTHVPGKLLASPAEMIPAAPLPAAARGEARLVALQAAGRGEARLVNWTQDGTLVAGAEVEAAWGVKRQTVDAARQRGEIFSVWVKGKHWYPGDALKFERPTLAKINAALGPADPSSKLLFLLRKHGALGGQTPADAVAAGKVDEVLRLASDWALA